MSGLFIVKPQEIIRDKRLTSTEQDYLCLIAALQNAQGCTASNAWFADYFGVTRQTAQEKIASLIAKNFLSRVEKKQGGKTVQRTLKIIDVDSRKLLLTDSRKSPVGLAGNSDIDSRKSPTLKTKGNKMEKRDFSKPVRFTPEQEEEFLSQHTRELTEAEAEELLRGCGL